MSWDFTQFLWGYFQGMKKLKKEDHLVKVKTSVGFQPRCFHWLSFLLTVVIFSHRDSINCRLQGTLNANNRRI